MHEEPPSGGARPPLGLIAGNGVFPQLVAKGARDAGVPVVAVAHQGETEEALGELVDACTWVRVGELGKVIRTLKHAGCKEAVLAGGIKKARLFRGFRPDLRGATFLAKVRSLHDDRLLRGIADELESEGIRVIPSTDYMPSLVPLAGPLTRRTLRARERSDVAFGLRVAKTVGRFEIGQTVVVKEGLVLAVEAVEGTDEAIRRGGQLSRGGAVVVKVSKPGQDLRFDVPAVGPQTIHLMGAVGATALAIEAGCTIVLEREEVVAAAERAGIAVIAVTAGAEDEGGEEGSER